MLRVEKHLAVRLKPSYDINVIAYIYQIELLTMKVSVTFYTHYLVVGAPPCFWREHNYDKYFLRLGKLFGLSFIISLTILTSLFSAWPNLISFSYHSVFSSWLFKQPSSTWRWSRNAAYCHSNSNYKCSMPIELCC